MKCISLIFFLLFTQLIFSQVEKGVYTKDSIYLVYNQLVNSIKPETEILGLGEQYHGDGTTFTIKSDLIQLLSKTKNDILK